MTVDPLVFYIMVAVIAFMIGLAKGGLGGTLGALATPLLALVMPADQVIGLILPVLMLAAIVVARGICTIGGCFGEGRESGYEVAGLEPGARGNRSSYIG